MVHAVVSQGIKAAAAASGGPPRTGMDRSGAFPASQKSPLQAAAREGTPQRHAWRRPQGGWTQPAYRQRPGGVVERCRARWRRKAAASAPKRPPTSTPVATRRARCALASSGYVWRRLRSAVWTAEGVWRHGCGSPFHVRQARAAPRARGAGRLRRPQCNATRVADGNIDVRVAGWQRLT